MPASKKKTASTRVSTRSYAAVSRAAKKTAKRWSTTVHERIMQRIERESQQPQLPITDEPWFSPRDIAEKIGVSIHAVRQWIRVGKLQYRRFGRDPRIPLSELERFSGGYSAASLKAIREATKKTRKAA